MRKPITPCRQIQQDLKKANLTFSQVVKPDPSDDPITHKIDKPDVIRIEGTRPAQSDAVSMLLRATNMPTSSTSLADPTTTGR